MDCLHGIGRRSAATARRWSASSSTARTAGNTTPAAAWTSCAPCTAAAPRRRAWAGVDRRFSGAASSAGDVAAPVRRQLDQPQLRHLDRPRGGQHGLGRPASRPRIPSEDRRMKAEAEAEQKRGGSDPASCILHPLKGPGESCTSPKAPTGSGGTATTTPAPRTPCSTTCSASICRTSTCCWATSRRPTCAADQPPRRRASTTRRRARSST